MDSYQQLKNIFTKIADLDHLDELACWDEAVMMPEGAGARRAKAMGTLHSLRHELLIDPKIGELVLQAEQEKLTDPWQQSNLRLIKKQHLKATCLPGKLVEAITHARMASEQAWRQLRAENNWKDFQPHLEKILNLVRESAQIRAEVFNKTPYDILLDDYSPDLTQEIIDPIFTELKNFLPDFCQQVIAKQQQDKIDSLSGHYPIAAQKKLGLRLMKAIGFDFNHGRLDVSHHPFTGGDSSDVRITTRYREDNFAPAIMAVCHETGHGLYELGLPEAYADQPVGLALGMSIHESQSLLIEMQACRSPEFLHYLAQEAKAEFGDNNAFSAENLFRQYTRVQPSYIRVDADEVTYPLHVILRYEIEQQLIAGTLSVAELPECWNDYMEQFLGISTTGNYKDGVMQDVHWPSGSFGYFPAYTLGAIIAAQLFQRAVQDQPNIPQELRQGNFTTLVTWLRKHIHQQGSLYLADELIQKASQHPLGLDAFKQHLKTRYLDS